MGKNKLFALHVKDETMADAYVHAGDIIVMKHQSKVQDGELAAVFLKDRPQTLLRRYSVVNGKVWLVPQDDSCMTITTEPENVEIQGKVVLVIRKLGAMN